MAPVGEETEERTEKERSMTREEAIQRFKGIINSMSISVAQSKFYPSKTELNELCDMAIESLSADAVQGWIPVSERLPIPPTFCLVTTDGNHGDVIDIALYMSDGWHKASEVLAWMPLPEPYREDDSDG